MERQIRFNRYLGLRVEVLRRERCVLRLPWRDDFLGDPFRPSVHGGVISMLADTAGGTACFAWLADPSVRLSTVDLRVDYLRPMAGADIVCVARVVRMGNRVGVARAELFAGAVPLPDEEGEPIASAQAVYNVIRKNGE